MNLPRPVREITSKVGRAKMQAQIAQGKADRARGRFGRSGGSAPKREPTPKRAAAPTAGRGPKGGAVLLIVVGLLGALGAALLGLALGDTADDRLLFVLIGVPLGALLAILVVVSYRWAGLVERSG